MDLEFLGTLGWREALVAIVALLTLYILYILLRINRLRREVPPGHDITSEVARGAVRAYSVVQESEAQAHAVDISTAGHQASLTPGPAFPTEEQTFPWNEPPRTSSGLLSQPRIEVLEQELAQLRRELGALRSEIQTLRDAQRREQRPGLSARSLNVPRAGCSRAHSLSLSSAGTLMCLESTRPSGSAAGPWRSFRCWWMASAPWPRAAS